MRFSAKIIGTFALSLPLFGSSAHAQELRLDPATDNYRLTYFSHELGREVTIEIVPPNKVDPELELTAVERLTDGDYLYVYRVANRATPGSEQPIVDLELACPPRELARLAAPDGWASRVGAPSERTGGAPYCSFTAVGPAEVEPGALATGLEIRTAWLPAIGPANVWGLAPPVRFHPDETQEHDAELHEVVRTVSGTTGGWVTTRTVVPARDPGGLTAPAALDDLRTDVDVLCDDLGWITNAGVCRSLRVKLDEAARALARGRTDAARGQLESFLAELDAQHGEPPGKHVNENAYWLLRTNAEHVFGRL